MIGCEIDIVINNVIESYEKYRDASKRSIIAQKVALDWKILTEMHISHRTEMLTLYQNNREMREKLLKYANAIMQEALSKEDVELAKIASVYICQTHSINPFGI